MQVEQLRGGHLYRSAQRQGEAGVSVLVFYLSKVFLDLLYLLYPLFPFNLINLNGAGFPSWGTTPARKQSDGVSLVGG